MAALILIPLLPGAALAQSDSGEIRIVVTDDGGKVPIELARVLLDGPVSTSELTDKKGQVIFTDVPDGIYRARIAKSGYQVVTSKSFEVINGNVVTVAVTLALSTTLKVIGTVTAHSTAVVSSSSINGDSAQRKLSDDLAGALNKLSGVSVSTTGDDSDATQTVSLEGHDASQTQLSLDGIPLNAPGVAGNLGAYATDLFSGASVRTGPQAGGLGGGVNFSTLQPTLSWLSNAQLAVGSYGKHNASFAESGSFDKLGLAVQTTYRSIPSLADGDVFLDASGLDYSHDGDSTIYGDLAKFRYQFSDSQTLIGTYLNSNRSSDVICLRITNNIPCGYGPNNTSDGNTALYSLTDSALVGETTVQASLFATNGHTLLDELNRFVAGEAAPIGFSTDSNSTGYSINATLPERERHTFSIQAYSTYSTTQTSPLVAQAIPFYNDTQTSQYSSIQLTDSIHSNSKLNLSESAGLSQARGAASSALASLNATWRPTRVDAFSGQYAIGGVAASPSRSTILTDPASLRFSCDGTTIGGDTAYGNAPGDAPGSSSSISERLGYTRTLRHGSLSFQLYNQIQAGVVLPVQVNGSALVDLGVITPAYLDAVERVFDSQGGCGAAPGTPFDATQLYFSSPIGGVKRVYQGGSITGSVQVGQLVVQPYWNVNVSKAISNDPRVDNPFSITISGSQLPNIPLQRGGIVLDYKAPHSILEWLADAQYTAKNNANNLPAFTTFDAGVSANLDVGTLTLAMSNLTNTFGGVFAGPANAVPYQTLGGDTVATIARPLQPREISVTYGVKFGAGAPNSQTGAAFQARGPRGSGGGAGFATPGGGAGAGNDNGNAAGGGANGRGGFRNLLSPIPTAPPSNPLDVTVSQACPSTAAPQAQQLSTEVKAFVASIEAAKTASGYPQTMAAPKLDDATLTYHGLGSTYALTITPTLSTPANTVSPSPSPSSSPSPRGGNAGFARLRAYFGCLPIHLANADDVKTHALYSAQNALFFVPQVTFMPSVGLYVVARQQQAGQETFRVYALPSAPPADPFVVRTATTCTPDLRATATTVIGELRAYFTNGTKPSSWTITAHDAKGGTWYELNPGDPTIIGAVLYCGRVAAGSRDDLTQRGFDGVTPPELNYAKSLGLYVLRPNRPPTAGGAAGGSATPSPAPGGGR